MSDKACLSNAELEATQRIQMHWPRGIIPAESLARINSSSKDQLEDFLTRAFGSFPMFSGDKSIVEPEPILKLISGGHDLVLGACDGTKVIAKAKKTFRSGIDSDFEKWRADESGQPTSVAVPDVYEMVKDATFSEMFGFLSADAGKLCFTQHQIIDFVEKYPGWLRTDGYGTFFLFKSYGHFFVARVFVFLVGLLVRVYEFGFGYVWRAAYRRRVVVPQLAA